MVLIFTTSADAVNLLQRDEDPVVILGIDLTAFQGENPNSIVAFRYESGWVQIPVQVDERVVIDFGVPYDTTAFGVTTIAYADTGTFTGADSDSTFDFNDELVLMAKDAGDARAPMMDPDPTGVVSNTRRELKVTNPINDQSAYVYLFITDGSLPQHANENYVTYDFILLSGDYKKTYSILAGPNLENSEVITDYYRVHFSDRWIQDEVKVKADSATQVDIFDRHKNLFAPGNCGRSENTFSAGEGCFIANIDGPVRAICSYLGANSGPLTQREHVFYENKHEITTYLRLHAISGVMDYYDYSPAATGMTYYNDLNTAGVTIDGDPTGDTITPGAITWEMVTGDQGTLVIAEEVITDIPGFSYTSYYSDDATPLVTQCTGDSHEYGASGLWVTESIPNTDPYLGPYYNFVDTRDVYYEEPYQTVSHALALFAQANSPLTVDIPTAVVERLMPPAIELMQNTPNPFNEQTRIRFRAPEGSNPVLRVYGVTGRLVKALVTAEQSAGEAMVTWDGTDFHGNKVSSGIYFYRLTVRGLTITRKMVKVE